MRFNSYEDAQEYQLSEWVAGRPWHNPWPPGADSPSENKADGECCPDFSCCNPSSLAPHHLRVAFASADSKARETMLWGMLTVATEKFDEDGSIYIAGDPYKPT